MLKMFKKKHKELPEVHLRPELSIEERFADPVLIIKNLQHPWGVTVNQKGEIVVSENEGHCVNVYSTKGEKLYSFGVKGKREGSFTFPAGVIVDNNDYIMVVDQINNRVQRFLPTDGLFVVAGGHYGLGECNFSHPSSIAFNHKNYSLYVADLYRVRIMNLDMSFAGRLGDADTLNSPGGIACDSAGNVYVADNDHHAIKVFSKEGQLLRQFNKQGNGKGELGHICDLAIDKTRSLLYATDNSNYCVSVFTTEGEFVTSFGKEGEGLGEMKRPFGITVDDNGVVYLCEGSRVQIF